MLRYIPFVILIVSFFSVGCERKEKEIIPKTKLIPIIVDLHKVDGLIISQAFLNSFPSRDNVSLYDPVFKKHGVSRTQFEKTIHYYSVFPLEFERIYEEVIAELTLEQTHLDELHAAAARDTISNLWPQKGTWNFPKDGSNNKIAFEIPVINLGLYTFSCQIRMYLNDLSVNPSISLWFWYDDGTEFGKRDSFPATAIKKDGKLHFYSVSKELTDTMYTHLNGCLLDHSRPDSIVTNHADVFQIRVALSNKKQNLVVSRAEQ